MNIRCVDYYDIETVREFLRGMNIAFSCRKSNENIQLSHENIEECDILKELENGGHMYIFEEENRILGGYCCDYGIEHNVNLAKIYHVWVNVQFQRRGIARKLLQYAEKEAKRKGCQLIRLNVANTYLPAIKLYKSEGYLPLKIYANEPKTYYFIRYMKPIKPYQYSNIKRLMILILSMIKFIILYRKDSSPTWMNYVIYGKRKEE